MGRYYPRDVYAIQHNETKKIYIGTSRDVQQRYRTHIWDLKRGDHNSAEMQSDFDKYGENYSLFILDRLEKPSENKREYEWMEKLRTTDPRYGYNAQDLKYKSLETPVMRIEDGIPTAIWQNDPNTCETTYYDKIKIMCTRKNISICQLEKMAGLGNGVISKWAESSPSADNLKKVSVVLGVDINCLFP